MALQKSEKIKYARISAGKIRIKTTQEDPDAEERYVEITKETVYEKVYKACEGLLIDIRVQTHEKYGTSYSLILFDTDEGEKYSLQMGEESRYFNSFAMHFPNIDFTRPVKVKPYSMTREGKTNLGLTFEQGGEKVENYYREPYNEKTKTSKPKNGLEKFNFKKVKGSKEDMKIMQMDLLKFLKKEIKPKLIDLKSYWEKEKLPGQTADDSTDDAPDAFEKGSRVSTVIDEETYEGEITSIKGQKANVTFDDGDKLSIDLDELELLTDEEDLPY